MMSGMPNMATEESIRVNAARVSLSQPTVITDVVNTVEDNISTKPQLDVIHHACGDKAYLLKAIPYDQVTFERHNDDVILAGGGKTPVIPVKFHVATDSTHEANYNIIIWAYMFENTETDPTPRIGYFGLTRDNEIIQYNSQSIVQSSRLTHIFPDNCSAGAIGALVKFYFYKLGIHLPVLPTFSKANTDDILRACRKFENHNQNSQRTIELDRSSNEELGSPTLTPRKISSEISSPINRPFAMMSRTVSPGLTRFGNFPETGYVNWSQASAWGMANSFFSQMSQISDQESRCEERLEGITAAKKEQEQDIALLKKKVKDAAAELKHAEVHLQMLRAQEGSEGKTLKDVKAAKNAVLKNADQQIKMIFELGIKIGHEENERKRKRGT